MPTKTFPTSGNISQKEIAENRRKNKLSLLLLEISQVANLQETAAEAYWLSDNLSNLQKSVRLGSEFEVL